MPSPDQSNVMMITWMVTNRPRLHFYARMLQMFTGTALLLIGWQIGHLQFHLLKEGVRTQGLVTSSALKRMGSRSSLGHLSYLPVVEFQAGGRTNRFEDWLGSRHPSTRLQVVPVLFDPANPLVAMIDRPVMNWLPWGPISAVGLLLLLAGIHGFSNFKREYLRREFP